MKFVFAIQLISVLLMFQPDTCLSLFTPCDVADWEDSLDHQGWSVCSKRNTYLKGLYRSEREPGDERVGRIENGECCPASESAYVNQPETCSNANWEFILSWSNVWALCPEGYFLNGLRKSDGQNLYSIKEGQCCRPQNQPEDSYDGCYEEDVSSSFDNKGWSKCQRDGYYMTGFFKGDCEDISCIEKFKCCRMISPAVNGGWTDFGELSECSVTCGEGIAKRSRKCTNPPPAHGGANCTGPEEQIILCHHRPCFVDGGWSEFGEWSECSVTCGYGQEERSRSCTNPPPAHGGANCSGADKEIRPCNHGPCSVDGGWSDFGDWSECSVTCGGGIRKRRRTCTNPSPSNGGECCVGDNMEAERCNIEPCEEEKVNGGWSNWSPYSECKSKRNCGKGRKTRTRTCTSPPPSGGGKECKGKSKQRKRCRLEPCKG